ncbi:hypothetical protein [Vibrio phage vB_ValS_PJ32]|nr:hypothetical protein [Vibrio phage vB_ValS_PJ32]
MVKRKSKFSVWRYFFARTFENPALSAALHAIFAMLFLGIVAYTGNDLQEGFKVLIFFYAVLFLFACVVRLAHAAYVVHRCRKTEKHNVVSNANDRRYVVHYNTFVNF